MVKFSSQYTRVTQQICNLSVIQQSTHKTPQTAIKKKKQNPATQIYKAANPMSHSYSQCHIPQ
jgi:hypothetical protein